MSFGRVFEAMIEVLHVKEMVRERMSGAASLLESSVYDRSVLSLRQGELPSNAKPVKRSFGRHNCPLDLGQLQTGPAERRIEAGEN
jgi:hypothetical protein